MDNLGEDDERIVDMLGTIRAMMDEIEFGPEVVQTTHDTNDTA